MFLHGVATMCGTAWFDIAKHIQTIFFPRKVITLVRHERKDLWAKAELERRKKHEEKESTGKE